VVHRGDGAGVAGVDVVLYALSPDGPGVRRTRSDEQGSFRFEGISTGPEVTYLLGARYRGVPFAGTRVRFQPGTDQVDARIEVTDLTRSPGSVRVQDVTLQLHRIGRGLRVVETIALRNDGERTYYVPASARPDGEAALRARLIEGATDFSMPLGVIPEGVEQQGTRIRFWGPVHPGSQEISWSYRLPEPADATGSTLRLRFPTGTAHLTVLLSAAAGSVQGPGLQPAPDRTVEGRSYRALERGPLAPGARLDLSLALTPARVDPGALHVTDVQLVLQVDDAAVEVTETHNLEVKGDTAIQGTQQQPLLRIPLPEELRDLRFADQGGDLELIPDPHGGLAAVGIAPPGKLRVDLAYRLPVSRFPIQLARQFGAKVPLLSLFVADTGGLLLRSQRLHRRRPVRTSDLTYQHLEAFDVTPDESVPLEIGVQEAPGATPAWIRRAVEAALALAVLGLLVSPLSRPEADRPPSALGIPAARREREALYQSIRDLDEDFEMGKISPADHESLRGELRARALSLLRAERAASGPGPLEPPAPGAPEPGPAHCAGCGAPAQTEHRFCPHCGAALHESGRAARSG